ncbi:hypothetical protein BB775_12255 [Enterobacter roggenkampii]|nr:hypothetical protein BBX43_18315 [Enterobacter roggenkampii]OHY63612.1 hypothetical protein BB775_12255 [Enterobacter roggenkampii]
MIHKTARFITKKIKYLHFNIIMKDFYFHCDSLNSFWLRLCGDECRETGTREQPIQCGNKNQRVKFEIFPLNR